MIYLIYILFSALICMWATGENKVVYLIFYLLLFYAMVIKIVYREKEVFTNDLSRDFILGIIAILFIYLQENKNN